MAAVIEVVQLGRAARSEASVKIRQPLPGILVYSRDPGTMEAVVRMKDQITDELNVKDVAPLVDLGDVVTYNIRPNLSLLGPKYGKQLGAIRSALVAEDSALVASRVSSSQPIVLTIIDGSQVSLEPEEVLVDLKKQDGYAAAQGPTATVVLDTALTPELLQEGLARDFVRGVQDARKSAGYRIEDRILTTYEADPEVVAALEIHRNYVMTETLSDELAGTTSIGVSDAVESLSAHDKNGYWQDQITVGQHHVRVALRRVDQD